MLLIIATIAVLGVLLLFIWDTSKDQETSSKIFSYYTPFYAESVVTHEYLSSPESVWKSLTNLDSYQSWFPKINRLLPDGDTDRYVHQFSFDKFSLLPGARLLLRPNSWSPFYKSRVVVVNKNEKITFDLKLNPLYREYVDFSLKAEPYGTSVVCRRISRGLFSIFSLWGFSSSKYKILENLGFFISSDIKKDNDTDKTSTDSTTPSLSRGAIIAQSVQAGLEGNMDLINAIPDKPTRGLAKSTLIQTKRKGGILPENLKEALLEVPSVDNTIKQTGDKGFASQEERIAYLVNLALDGDDELLNAESDRVIRGKAKAMIIKIKRGSVDRPPVPVASAQSTLLTVSTATNQESEKELILRLVKDGVGGNMDEINSLDNKLLRGKVKSAIVREKRANK
jgi:hypothetical protein